uniref:HAT C-terminal dimerisation domain-containing protein n=1 Tax=Globisporangium ultimum (strain ATCC 200006 / CBS 805.95 / DAOM BR144) TaxID=431595 RepID=K3WYD2_GLOUD
MLGYFLPPRYVDKARQLPIASISSPSRISHFAVYYYRRFIGPDFGHLRDSVSMWLTGRYTYTTPDEFSDPVAGFWRQMQQDRPSCKLPRLAFTVLSIAVNTATCERLFSELALIHTAIRNRMTSNKAKQIQAVRQQSREATGRPEVQQHVKRIISPVDREERESRDHQHVTSDYEWEEDEDTSESVSPPAQAWVQEWAQDDAPAEVSDSAPAESKDSPQNEMIDFWESYLDEIDVEVFEWDRQNDRHSKEEPVNAREAIPNPDLRPFPEYNEKRFPQDGTVTGIRSHAFSLEELFRLS